MEKCDFCLYREGCIGEIPGPDGKCMAFAVPKEDVAAYEKWMKAKRRAPELRPSHHGEDCPGNGKHPGIECCCDECDHYLTCFPDWRELKGE